MTIIAIILLVLAAACFAVAAFNLAAGRINFIGLGLLLFVLAELIPALAHL
jgi:hypothetical protein